MNRRRPLVVVTEPINTRLEKIQEKLLEVARFTGDDSGAVRTGNWIVAEIEDALKEASEMWMTTHDAALATGWTEGTLKRWARKKIDGAPLAPAWKQVQVKKTTGGYAFRVSTLPIAPVRAAA